MPTVLGDCYDSYY